MTSTDTCAHLVASHVDGDQRQLLDVLVRYTGLVRRTPIERIAAAVDEEIRDLTTRPRPDAALEAFEARLRWLLQGTSAARVARLDPVRDCDRIFHAVGYAFRVEARLLDLLAMLRIAQASSLALFFRSTREAEDHSVRRFHDTMGLFANYFEWGADSVRGRAAVARINEIHGRYHVPPDGMRFVLLNSAFTWLEGAERIGHRPLLDVEREGYFHAYVKLGRAMHITGLTDDYREMYEWFTDVAAAHARHHPLKTDTFETIAFNSLDAAGFPGLREALLPAARVAMHDSFRRSLCYPAPTPAERERVRGAFFTLGTVAERLPPVAYLRSLQNNPARPRVHAPPGELGVDARSPHLPVAEPGDDLPLLDWAEIRRHDHAGSLWVVLDGDVHDLTGVAVRHPGGAEALLRWAGRDATAAFAAAPHSPLTGVLRLNFRIGRVTPPGGRP